MSRANFYSLLLCLALAMAVLTACQFSPDASSIESPLGPGEERGTAEESDLNPAEKDVAILVVDWYSGSTPRSAEDADATAGASTGASADASSPNCVSRPREQVNWVIVLVDETIPQMIEVVNDGGQAPKEIGHGDLVFSEVAEHMRSTLTPDDKTPFDGSQLIYHQGEHNFLVRRVPVFDRTTQAVADSIREAVETLRGEGITNIVINMSFVLVPCEPLPVQTGLSAEERVNVGVASLNTILAPVYVDDEPVISSFAVDLNNQLYNSLNEAGVTIENYERLLPEPPAGDFTIDDPAEGADTLAPCCSLPLHTPEMGTVEELIRPAQSPTTADLTNPSSGFAEPGTLVNDVTAIYPDSILGFAYERNAIGGLELGEVPLLMPSSEAISLGTGATAARTAAIAAILGESLILQLPVTWTLQLQPGITSPVVAEQLDTSPALGPLRTLEAYTPRLVICDQFPVENRSQQLQEYCNTEAYVDQINDLSSDLVNDDPLYQLLEKLHDDDELRVISIGAAGNFSATYPYAPASWPQVISVGANANPYFIGNGAEVQMTGFLTLTRVLLGSGEIVNTPRMISGTSFAAPLLSVLAAQYLAAGGELDCIGADGDQTTRPPLNYATWEPDQPPNYGDWQNLTLAEARERYCALFPEK